MTKVAVEGRIEATADATWGLLRDFGGIRAWNPGIEAVTVDGEGVGAVRTISLPGGTSLQEKLEAHDDDVRCFSYSFTGKPILPIREYYATLRVTPDGDACRIDWSSTFEPDMPEEQAKSLIEGIYTGGIAALKKALE